jgi:hypothetical protein
MPYNFRIRVNRSDRNFINSDQQEIKISASYVAFPLFLKAAVQGKSIKEAEQLVLLGEGFDSKSVAREEGQRFEDVFMIALAKGRIGADFGQRAPKSAFSEVGLQAFFPGPQRSLNNVHGLMVYPSDPRPQFVAMGPMSLLRGITVEDFLKYFEIAALSNRKLTPSERVAFTLYNSSFFQPSADARFVLLSMAIEALIKPASISSESAGYVDGFIAQIRESPLEQNEKNSLLGRLGWLRLESITKAGQRLAREKLGGKIYEGKNAEEFFAYIYDLRSRLVHGIEPFPSFQEIHRIAAPVEVFASDLLTS